jgi:hypothetical protein
LAPPGILSPQQALPPNAGWPPTPHPDAASPAIYPPSGYGNPVPRRFRGWIGLAAAVVAIVAGGLVWWTQRPISSATGKMQTDGTTVVDSHGIFITAPVGWTVVATTPAALAKASRAVTQSNPQLASAMRSLESRQQNGALRFFAYGHTALGGSTSTANVLVTHTTAPLNTVVAANSAELSSDGASNMTDAPIAGDAEELTYQLPLHLANDTVTLNIQQIFKSNGSELGILTMGTTGPTDSSFPTLVNSFRLT